MFGLTVVLTVLLLAVIAAVTFAFFIIVRENRQLKKDNSDLLSRPDSIGLSYKTDSKDVQVIMQLVSDIMLDLQSTACPSIRKEAVANKKEFLKSISQDADGKPIKCSDIRKKYNKHTTKYGKNMANGLASYLPPEKAESIQNKFKALSEAILTAVCTMNKIDVVKADNLFTDVIDAICYTS